MPPKRARRVFPKQQPALPISAGTPLDEYVGIHRRHLRSANVERHVDVGFAEDYIPTPRGLEVLRRVFTAAAFASTAGRAWSLTGPYGAGKSSFAAFLACLTGPKEDPETVAALGVLRRADHDLWGLVSLGRDTSKASDHGFLRAVVTAEREPILSTLVRGIDAAIGRYFNHRRPRAITQLVSTAQRDLSGGAICAVLDALADTAPVLIVIDEFGKCLEHFVAEQRDSDLYVLQQIAEMASGRNARPVFLVTLQHAAVDDYVRAASLQQRREWGKVRGRFQEIPFVETPEQSMRLVSECIDGSRATPEFRDARAAWAQRAASLARECGLGSAILDLAGLLETCYPLHPVTLLALPEMCAKLGQYGRTLFAFLASDDPEGLVEYLRLTAVDGARLPSLTLDRLYDFFSESVGGIASSSLAGARWLEVDTRIREATGLDAQDRRLLKVVGVLNLLGRSDSLRASLTTVSFAMTSEVDHEPDGARWRGRLQGLEARGFLTYRGFADEYRLWEGTDLDLAGSLRAARERLRGSSSAVLLNRMNLLTPVVAARNSQEVGMLRYFDATFADGSTSLAAPDPSDPADGRIVYFLGAPEQAGDLALEQSSKPVVIVTAPASDVLVDKALEVAATHEVLDSEAAQRDRVARRELQEREAAARDRLRTAFQATFDPSADSVAWRLHGWGERNPVRGLSSMLSYICDDVYSDSPAIHNEMLGRQELTSQGARARRELLIAMVEHAGEERLGIQGHGPERAMYEAFLHHTGVHRPASHGVGNWEFGPPEEGNPLRSAWTLIESVIDAADSAPVAGDAVYAALMAPPIGMKDGPIPVLLTAVLLSREDDVAVFQDGTFQTKLSADALERLTKGPEHFSFRSVAAHGARGRVLRKLAEALAVTPTGRRGTRNASLLSVVAPLVAAVRALPEYTLRTNNLSPAAKAVRAALTEATDPADLLFTRLPVACGHEPMRTRTTDGEIMAYAQSLRNSVDELRDSPATLARRCSALMSEYLFGPGPTSDLRAQLRARASLLTTDVLEAELRSFLHHATDDVLDDDAWVDAMMLTISSKPSNTWRDDDVARFSVRLRELAGTLSRLESLHLEARDRPIGAFDARRVVITSPTGDELSSVVWIDEDVVSKISNVVEEAISRATEIVGFRGPESVLALLAARLLSGEETSGASLSPTPRRRPAEESTS